MGVHPHEALVRQLDEFAKTGDYERIREVVTPDVAAWSPTYDLRSADELVDAIRAQNDAVTDISTELTVNVAGDSVFWESIWRGSYPAFGKSLELRSLSIGEVREGRLASIRQYWDNLGVMRTLGLLGNS